MQLYTPLGPTARRETVRTKSQFHKTMHPTAAHNNKWANLQNLIPRANILFTCPLSTYPKKNIYIAELFNTKSHRTLLNAQCKFATIKPRIAYFTMVEEFASQLHTYALTSRRRGFDGTQSCFHITRQSAPCCRSRR